jgi:hypothetical protein
MRITKLAVAAAGLTLGLAACSSSGSTGAATPGASGSTGASAGTSTNPSGGSGTSAGVANSCVVGNWKTTSANLAFDSAGAHGSATGGSGLLLTIAADGKTAIDFGSMQPITFSTAANGTEVKGSFAYGGKAAGTVQVDGGTANKGAWKPVGTADWRDMTVTVDLLSPVQSRIFDHVKIADFATANSGQTGGSVEIQPILQDATYDCSGDTLKLGPPAGAAAGGTWVMTRA